MSGRSKLSEEIFVQISDCSYLFIYLFILGLMSLKKFFFPFIFINWRLITLQYCSADCSYCM